MNTRRFRRGAIVLSTLVGAALWAGPAAHAAGRYSISAPYSSASHSTTETCPWPDVSPHCGTAAQESSGAGAMRGEAYTDSGAYGTLPGTGESDVTSRIDQAVDLHGSSRATVVVHVHVAGVTLASSGLGRSYVYVSAASHCPQCNDDQTYEFVEQAGDVPLQLAVNRTGGTGPVTVETALEVITEVDCDQFFCLAPTGTARASASATLSRIEVIPR